MRNRTEPGSYGQFCPVAMAAEIVCSKWTPLVMRELLSGSTRFNKLRRGGPRMSPTLLSKRLKELEEAGVISARAAGGSVVAEYKLTQAGEDLRDGCGLCRRGPCSLGVTIRPAGRRECRRGSP